jgi:hypothetical protein
MGSENVSFNLQQFLQDMREEQKQDHDALAAEIKAALGVQAEHDKRITLLERSRVTMVKAVWLIFGAIVVFGFDLLTGYVSGKDASAAVNPPVLTAKP